MERSKYLIYYENLRIEDIYNCKARLKPEELKDLEKKIQEISATQKFSSFESQSAFEKAFLLGYVSSFIEYPTEEIHILGRYSPTEDK